MFMRTFLTLMWKHYLTRKKKWYCTIVELVLPIAIFFPSFLGREALNDPSLGKIQDHELSVWRLAEPVTVLYTPETKFTRTLMDMVAHKLNMQLLNTLPDKSHNYMMRGYSPFTRNLSVTKYSKTMGPDEAIVVFHNVSDSQPERLDYSIRMRSPRSEFGLFRAYHPEWKDLNEFDIHNQFLRLQWAIDSSFIRMLTGKEVTQACYDFESLSVCNCTSKITSGVEADNLRYKNHPSSGISPP